MSREVTFTMKEVTRYGVIQAVLEKRMSTVEAAAALHLSARQIKRIKKKIQQLGPVGVRHGNWGRRPVHGFDLEFKQKVIHLAKTRYHDFNFSHLSEILAEEDGIHVNRETLRLWLRPQGLGSKVRKKRTHRTRRKRCAREGQMLFLDGSPHQWFGSEPSCLILCTDDATGKPLHGVFQKQEDLNGCFGVCFEVFLKYGLPSAFYLDRASQFTTTRHGGLHVSQSDKKPTQFERAMQELGVHLISANSPQARGRAERINGAFQDRLIAELRLRGIDNASAATRYLNEHFIPKYGRRFGVAPENPQASWRPLAPCVDLHNVLCRRYERTVINDNTISIKNQVVQLLPTSTRMHFVRAKVIVNQWLDGSFHVFHPTEGEIPCKSLGEKRVRPTPGARPAGAIKKLTAGERSESAPPIFTTEACSGRTLKRDIFTLQKR